MSMGMLGNRCFSSLTTVWQRTKSPIHMYGTIKMGDSDISWSHRPMHGRKVHYFDRDEYKFIFCPLNAYGDGKPLACPCQPVQGGRTRQDCPRPFLHLQPGKLHAWAPWGKGGGQHWRRGWMLLVTGGAGFIGSNLVAGLNEAGRTDIVVNDAL